MSRDNQAQVDKDLAAAMKKSDERRDATYSGYSADDRIAMGIKLRSLSKEMTQGDPKTAAMLVAAAKMIERAPRSETVERDAIAEEGFRRMVETPLSATREWTFVPPTSPDSVLGGAPVTAGVTIYTFDERGMWIYDLPRLPEKP